MILRPCSQVWVDLDSSKAFKTKGESIIGLPGSNRSNLNVARVMMKGPQGSVSEKQFRFPW